MDDIQMTDEEKSAIASLLESELWDFYFTMSQKRADTLHGLYTRLTGKNHETWESRGGIYGKK